MLRTIFWGSPCLLWGALLIFCSQCQNKKAPEETNTSEVEPLPNIPFEVEYARSFAVEFYQGYKKLQLFRRTREVQDTLNFILIKKGQTPPTGFEEGQIIEVPIDRIIPLSTTFIEPLKRLGLIEQIVGIENADYITDEALLEKISQGKIPEVARNQNLNAELILSLRPDLIMTSGLSSSPEYQTLQSAGIQIIPNLDWQETDPLGRAEWVKYMSLFFGKEKEAKKVFQKIEKAFSEALEIAKQAQGRPTVLVEIPFKGTWYVSGGDSYMANLLKLAGADYPWQADTTAGAIPLDIEAVYPIALEADYWINLGTLEKKSELMSIDSRFADFKAVKQNQLYNNNKTSNAQGGNDYWNTGIMNPDLILLDFLKIFHPELLPDYELTYYQALAP